MTAWEQREGRKYTHGMVRGMKMAKQQCQKSENSKYNVKSQSDWIDDGL